MTNILTTSLIVAISYCVLKYIETRVLDKNDEKPLKFIMRDTFIVFFASCIGIFIIEQLNDLQKEKLKQKSLQTDPISNKIL